MFLLIPIIVLIIFEICPIDISELIKRKMEEIYNIAEQQAVQAEDVTKDIDDYMKQHAVN